MRHPRTQKLVVTATTLTQEPARYVRESYWIEAKWFNIKRKHKLFETIRSLIERWNNRIMDPLPRSKRS